VLLGLDQVIVDQLVALISDGTDENDIVVCFLTELSRSDPGKNLSHHVKRLIRIASRKNPAMPESVSDAMSRLIETIEA
jgi:hypothetical protein